MSLLDDLLQESAPAIRDQCKVADILDALDGVDVDGDDAGAVLREASENPRITSSAIARLLGRLGYPLANSTVQRHRKGDCACG